MKQKRKKKIRYPEEEYKKIKRRKNAIAKLKKYPYGIPEVYDLHVYLAQHIEKALLAFREVNVNSVPAAFEHDHDAWPKILDDMIYSFHEIGLDYPNDPALSSASYDNDWIQRVIKRSSGDFIEVEVTVTDEKKYKDTMESFDAYHDKIKNGLQLFGKYFQDLWD